ncbi:uncharacterized protein DNG_06320 [Cephalotrichum gorgonifer]|uniref:Ysc84 actin-binding domain-containing protein n=1 Tax=Cephalotrichum gorgonifer TaxID=2041049 RepID=A0AAE8MZS6_9PEZI|nr:uncharacterized protein DNG_06320 [Cephalotrichum gorgonifer]
MADPNYPSQSGSQEFSSQQSQQAEQAQQAQYPYGYPPKPPTEQKTYQAYNPPATHQTDAQAAVSSGALPSHEPQASQTTYGANPNPLGANPVTSQFAPPPPQHSNETPLPEPNPHLQPAPADVAHGANDGHRKKSWSTRMHELGTKAATPINALANKLGSQSFLPTTMDKECEKAASILLSFCKDGAHGEGHRPASPTAARSRSRDRAILKIPAKVLANAVGLAIFTTARVGFQFSASTGSGVLIARLPDRSWGPPSGIQVHALGAGFLAGADIYDCICVINTREALDAFTNTRVSLGPDLAVAAGPFGVGGKLDVGAGSGGHSQGKKAAEAEAKAEAADPSLLSADKERPAAAAHKRSSSYKAYGPVFTYVKSRGLFAGVQVDGTVITERKEANAAFYGERIPASRILRGENVPAREAPALWPAGARPLHDALRRAESRSAGDEVIVPPSEATPAINDPKQGYGQGQGQGGHDPIPRSGDPKTGTVSGEHAHATSDELPGYEGAWAPSSARDEKAPLPGSGAGVGADVIPRADDPKTGTVSGEHAHATSDELPGYDGPKAPVQDQKPHTYQ